MKKHCSNPVIVVDETGVIHPSSFNGDDDRKFFTIVATFVKNPKEFKKCIKSFPKTKGEVKYSKIVMKDKKKIFQSTKEQDFSFSYVHKHRSKMYFRIMRRD